MKRLKDLPDSPLDALVSVQNVNDTDEVIITIVRKVEDALDPEKGYGDLPYVFSRNKRDDSPDNNHWLQHGKTTRLLDKPSIMNELIERTVLHVEERLREVLGTFAGLKRARPYLGHNINAQKHKQKATLLSYLIRAFCPDNTQAIIPENSIYLEEEDIMTIIQVLPLDPDKLSDETLQKIGLALDDYETYTLQARRRYKLWIREKFFQMMAHAEVFSFDVGTQRKKSTARIMHFYDANNQERVGAFINASSLHIHITPAQKKTRHKLMDTYFRVFDGDAAFMRSQSHALEKIVKKGDMVGLFQDLFSKEGYASLSPEEKSELLVEAQEYFSHKPGFHEKRVAEFIGRIEAEPYMKGNVVTALESLDLDLTGKYHELREVLRLFRIQSRKKKST